MSIQNSLVSPVIRKSNDLIVACSKLTVSEQRILVLLASEILPSDEDFKDYELRVSDFAKMFSLEINGLYVELENTSLNLMKQQIKFKVGNTIEVINWLSYIKYVKGSGIVKLRFDKALKPYLLQLKSHYTQYDLNSIVSFKGRYSVRFYELLKMEAFKANKRGQFERFFEISELREILGVDDVAYPIFADFKRYLVEPSMREITKETDLTINDVRYGKTGRKITNVTFVVNSNTEAKKTLEIDQFTKPEARVSTLIETTSSNDKNETCPVIDSLLHCGISLPVADIIKSKYDIDQINRNIKYTIAKQSSGEIKKTVAGYLKTAIEKDYAATSQSSLFDVVKNVVVTKDTKVSDKKQIEQDAKDKKHLYQLAFNAFLLLPLNQQEELKQSFFEKSDETIKMKIKDAQRKQIDIFISPMVSSPFKVFLVENGF